MTASLYLYALRAARLRQVRARAVKPVARRRFPKGAPPRSAAPVSAVEALWRSAAFEVAPPPDVATRLGRFQRQYGEDVLAAARRGDLETTRALLESWIEAHPPRNDDAWHPYPLSSRVGNWVAALTLLPELGSQELSHTLWRQLLRLERNVEDDVLGNHLIRNARALVLGGAAFDAQDTMRRGIDLLRRELPEQVLADGGHYERSPSYHLVALRDLLEVQAVSPHSWLADAIERMKVFAAALRRPDGAPALFNDGTIDAPRLELPAPPEGLAVLEPSGFAVVREHGLWLAFRCGPVAPRFLPAHAHADALSLHVWWRGRPVIVDAGSSTYDAGPERSWERSTKAHSTVIVDGKDQFRVWRAFRSGPLPEVKLLYARPGAVEASVALPGGLRHVRRVEWNAEGGELTVHDMIDGRGSRHRLESRVLLAPSPPDIEVDWIGLEDAGAEEAWTAERIGERVPTTALRATATVALPASIGFRLRFLE